MIVVRDIFQLHFGKAREAIAAVKEMQRLEKDMGYPVSRILTDVTGEYYTLVMESSFGSLADFEAALQRSFDNQEWRTWYSQFVPLIREGRREIFRVVE